MDPVFRWRHFAPEVILLCVRWYCKYGISYRELEDMMAERGITVDHTTLYRCVQRYAPELEKHTLWYQSRLSFLKKEGLLAVDCHHRQVKYLNNRLESDHGKLKRLIKPTLGFHSMRTAYATIKGFEVMRMFKKRQFDLWLDAGGGGTETRFINRLFGVHA